MLSRAASFTVWVIFVFVRAVVSGKKCTRLEGRAKVPIPGTIVSGVIDRRHGRVVNMTMVWQAACDAGWYERFSVFDLRLDRDYGWVFEVH